MSSFALNALKSDTEIEISVGISAQICSHQGFQGILKQRFNDFVVREIAPGGEVTKLTSVTMTPELTALENKYFTLTNKGIENVDGVISEVEGMEDVTLRAPKEEIRKFFEQCIAKAPDCPTSLILCSCEGKQQRSAVHQAIKSSYAVIL